mmetsp:Transcript_20581/g.33918  ORF Transcript_20581/g.33918 Transcript_20581/m.33918 type:complete len:928 (+) Transcript_20581:183-2966(+)
MAESADTNAELRDISNSPAYTFLDELHAGGRLTQAQIELYKSRYAKLYEVVLTTYENEKSLLKKAKALNQELLAERVKLEKAGVRSAEDGATIVKLRSELGKAETEVSICEERENMLRMEVSELNRLKTDSDNEMAARRKAAQDQIEPQIMAINAQITEVKADINKFKAHAQRMTKDKNEVVARIDTLTQHRMRMAEEYDDHTLTMAKLKMEPEKIKKQADVVQAASGGLEMENDKALTQLRELENAIKMQEKQIKVAEEDREETRLIADRNAALMRQRESSAEDIRRQLQRLVEDANTYAADKVKQEMDLKHLLHEAKRETENLLQHTKDKDVVLRKTKKAEQALQSIEDQMPVLQTEKEHLTRQLEHLRSDRKQQTLKLEELRRDVDIYINNFLKTETAEKEKTEKLAELVTAIKELEIEVATLSVQEHDLGREIIDLSSQREKMAREAGKALSRYKETKEDIKVRDLVIMDLGKKNADSAQRLKEFVALYDMVKNERNKYVNLIQAAAQAAAEMRDKLKILENEIEILRSESVSKDRALAKERSEHQNAFTARDGLRSDWNKNMFTYREKQEHVEQQMAEVDKLNSVINAAEKEMVRLKRMYEMAVEDRNYTGIQLIDRNDELCILYEKSNIQESVLRRGEVEMRKREEDVRMLRLQANNTERDIVLTRKLLPRIPELETSLVTLQMLVQEERTKTENLSFQLENAENKERWRKLGGTDPDPEELAVKIRHIEERLNEKKEQLLEKDLVLEEVSNLSDRLRKEASDGRSDTLNLAKMVNTFQAKIKNMTKDMMATVSELSMYQAQALRLQQERAYRESEVDVAEHRLAQGLPPTEDAEQEWYRMERDRRMRADDWMRRQEQIEAQQAEGFDGTVRTTAEPRPNAYIDDEYGLPKPYGGYAPFKPQENGSTMRHIRRPQNKEIEI